ncbi:MAG: AAA family ATPase [Syntrophobacteraceae bacterium]|nr:AAA family ATPase [Syntrophobacteraceae bacterium]
MEGIKQVTFELALKAATDRVVAHSDAFREEVLLVRDLIGRIRVVLPGKKFDYDGARLDKFSSELNQALGAYSYAPSTSILFSAELFEGEHLFGSEDRRLIMREGDKRVWLLDRQIIGMDWGRAPMERKTNNSRVTFYGIKGGVGRSTALVVWAWWLAKHGKHVLIIDLDLESPGVSSTLLPPEYLPDYGIVDWFVEDGIGQSEIVERSMVAASPVAANLPGAIRVAPAFGRDPVDYLPKLARCYMDQPGKNPGSWGERLQRMVEHLELLEQPDVVFLDSRAGLHDIAAVLVTRMGADAFLFAVDSAQTWTAYSFLFRSWKQHPRLTDFRERLQMVAGMVPETGREEYLARFRERSWDLFREHIYDEATVENPDAFSFDLGSEEAPHYPLPILWNRALQEFDPSLGVTGVDERSALAALDGFIIEANKMVFPPEESA